MEAFFHFLQAQPFVALFGVLALGMMLGRPLPSAASRSARSSASFSWVCC
jgi:hypothetical protein